MIMRPDGRPFREVQRHCSVSNGFEPHRAAYQVDTGFSVPSQPTRYFVVKYPLERLIAMGLLLPAIPLILLFAVLVKATSRGPAIFRQPRVGQHGREFIMYKIRTMRADAEAQSGPMWSTPGDNRVTRVGRFLRMFHLDELPQLFNVVRGDMTVVGPRPERPEITSVLVDHVAGYRDRLLVKPGITGLAQIYLPPDECLDCVRKKLCYDRAYIQTANVKVDLKIWLCTAVRMMGIRKGRGPRWFRLDRRYDRVRHYCKNVDQASREGSLDATSREIRIATAITNGKSSNHSVVNGSARRSKRAQSIHAANGNSVASQDRIFNENGSSHGNGSVNGANRKPR